MHGKVGDVIVVRGRHLADDDRQGTIVEIHGQDGAPPFLIRWHDGHESVFFPSSDTVVQHLPVREPGSQPEVSSEVPKG